MYFSISIMVHIASYFLELLPVVHEFFSIFDDVQSLSPVIWITLY